MTLGELINADFLLEGYRKIQSADEDNPEVYFEGDWEGNIEHLFDREIISIYPYFDTPHG